MRDLMIFAGLIMLFCGLWMAYPPCALVTTGIALAGAGFFRKVKG